MKTHRATVVDCETIVDGKVTVLGYFSSEDEASKYIATLPGYETGRYGLDVEEETYVPEIGESKMTVVSRMTKVVVSANLLLALGLLVLLATTSVSTIPPTESAQARQQRIDEEETHRLYHARLLQAAEEEMAARGRPTH